MMRVWQLLGILAFAAIITTAPSKTLAEGCPGTQPFELCHSFTGPDGDGEFPEAGPVLGSDGNLYGTTFGGFGTGPVRHCSKSCGTLYSLQPIGGAPIGTTSFDGATSGDFPVGEMALLGNAIYGTTEYGPGTGCGGLGCGTIFKQGRDKPKFKFGTDLQYTNGALPQAGLIANGGDLYGTTKYGGRGDGSYCGSSLGGCGTVFKFSPKTGKLTVLHSFFDCSAGPCPDGAIPISRLLARKDKASGTTYLYGTTEFGGANRRGTIFRVDTAGNNYQILYNFCSVTDSQGVCTDGSEPQAGVAADKHGNLYGTTTFGGVACEQNTAGCGLAFKWPAGGSVLKPLHAFTGQAVAGEDGDGTLPESQLTRDATTGTLYGTTLRGGAAGCYSGTQHQGCGIVFAIGADGSYNSIYVFCKGGPPCLDGSHPVGALLLSNRSLYGATRGGGNTGTTENYGEVYRINLP